MDFSTALVPAIPNAQFVAEAVLVGWGSSLYLLGEVAMGGSSGWRQDAGCAGVRLAWHLPALLSLKGKVPKLV